MATYTTNLNLKKPAGDEQYNIADFNNNADIIDQFAGQTPPYALTADSLRVGAKINGVNFKGDTDIVTGAGFYYDTVTYSEGDLAFIYNQDGALELHKSLQDGNIGNNPLTSTGYWQKQDLGGSGGRNVGEIVTSSLPLTDAGLHLLDGARLSGDGIYKEFYDYIAELYAENPDANYFTTEAEWQSAVTTYGVCGKFVYNSTNNTVRLPKYSNKIYTQSFNNTAPVVGNGMTLGLTQGNGRNSGFAKISNVGLSVRDNVFGSPVGSTTNSSEIFSNGISVGVTTDTNNSGIIAQLSNITTSMDCYYYIVIATSTKTDIQVDIDNIATDLNGKLDTDLTNATDSAKVLMSGMGMPSAKFIDLTLGADGSSYTAPANGWYVIRKSANAAGQYWYWENSSASNLCYSISAYNSNQVIETFIPVKKGDILVVWYNLGGTTGMFRFIYAQGSESEIV